MNKRIQELAKAAGFYVARDGKIYIPTIDEEITAVQERFAQLMVQEVLSVQEKLISDGHNAWHLHKPTKEHFGVE